MKAERRRGKLWAPKGKTLPLQGLVDPSGETLSSPLLMKGALRERWAPVFAPKSAPFQRLDACPPKHVKQFDWSDLKPPAEEQLRSVLFYASPTAPGPDRLPYWAWK
eukprot:1174621-Pyramimonas_sp.AAC.1